MLERAAACLETGGIHLSRGRKQALRSRRLLHSAFWQHGAGDINLPGWWTSLLLVQQHYEREDEESSRKEASAQVNRGMLLDFLYPAKTMAYLKKISAFSLESWERHQARRSAARGCRRYTSMAGDGPEAPGGMTPLASDDFERKEHKEGLGDNVQAPAPQSPYLTLSPLGESVVTEPKLEERESEVKDPLQDLKNLLQSPGHRDYSLAWQKYLQCRAGPSSVQPEVIVDLLRFLSASDRIVEAERYMTLLNTLPLGLRSLPIVESAIVAQQRRGKLGGAAILHDELVGMMQSSPRSYVGTNLLLAQCIHRGYWQLATHVYQSFLTSRPTPLDLFSLWDNLKSVPLLLDKVLALVTFSKEVSESGGTLEANNAQFITLLAKNALLQEPGLEFSDPVLHSMVDGLLSGLDELRLLNRDLFETTLEGMYNMPSRRRFSNNPVLRLVWFRYRAQPDYMPSSDLLNLIAVHITNLEARKLMELVRADCEKYHGTVPNRILVTLMAAYARMGDAAEVHSLFAEFRKQVARLDRVNPLRSLVYVHARRAEVNKAHEQFDRILEEFKLTPDVHCWNILIHAHSRVEDLDGALQCLDGMVQSGCQPDEYTFGPLMNLCATRGDLDTVQKLLDMAESSGIKPNSAMLASLVMAHINVNDIAEAEAVVEASSKLLPAKDQTIIWTMLLNGYALRADLKSLMRVYREMQNANVPLDSMSYAALMHGLTVVHQTDAAYKILRRVMPREQIRVLAFHYATVMSGFADQGDHEKALRSHQRMLENKIRPTVSTRVALLKATALAEFDKMRVEGVRHHSARLSLSEDLLDEILDESDAIDIAARQPRKGIGHTPLDQVHPSSYFEMLISLYGKRRSFEAVGELFEKYIQKAQSTQPQRSVVPPVQLLTALMRSHLGAREHEELAKCWILAKAQADRLTKIWSDSPPPSDDGVHSQSVTLPFVRRSLLTGALQLYVQSLSWQSKIDEMKSVVSSVLSSGYALNNQTWNTYVQALAFSGSPSDLLLAFSICEEQLMPGWTGWAVKNSGSDQKGGKKMGLAHIRTKGLKHGHLLPHYKTLVVLAAKLADMRGSRLVSSEGLGVEDLRRVASGTVHAIMGMPMVEDRLQKKHLRVD